MIDCYIGLGSNLDRPLEQLRRAFTELAQLPASSLVAQSSFYGSHAIGPGVQDDYVNAAAQLRTSLSPQALLDALLAIELAHGRKRELRWQARPLDLDLLLYGRERIDTPGLTVPHPRMLSRPFVMAPLAELGATLPGIELGQPVDYLSADSLWLILADD